MKFPGLCGICRRQTALSISLLPCAKGAREEEKRVIEAAGVSAVEFALFFFFHAHTHHLLVLMCSSFPGYTLIFQKAQKRFVFALLAQLNPPDRSYQSLMFLCGYFRTQ